jgi:hypothetical protein
VVGRIDPVSAALRSVANRVAPDRHSALIAQNLLRGCAMPLI